MQVITDERNSQRSLHLLKKTDGVRVDNHTGDDTDDEAVGTSTIRLPHPARSLRPLLLKPNQVYVTRSKTTRTRVRRIIALFGAHVVYCDGGEQPRRCLRREFMRWIRQYDAIASRARRPRTLVLRP